jgi:hypothetical protein
MWDRKVWAVLLVPFCVAWLGWWVSSPLQLDIGAPLDTPFVRGWYDREAGVHGTYRWSSPDAALDLPAQPGRTQISLRMVGRPEGSTIAVQVAQQPPITLTVAPEFARTYRLLSPGDTLSGITTIRLTGPEVPGIDAEDTRQLTVLLDRVELRSSQRTFVPPLMALLPALCALICLAVLRLLGLRRTPASVTALVVGISLALGWGWARLWVAPFLLPTALGALIVFALLAGIHWARQHTALAQGAGLLGAFAIFSGLIPIFTFVRYDWQNLTHWHNLPLLLIPLGLLLIRQSQAAAPGQMLRPVAITLLLVASLYGAGMASVVIRTDYGRDFHAIYEGVSDYVRGFAPLYNLPEIAANPLDALFKYPPSFALIFAPFALPSFVPALYAWRFVNLLLLGVALWALLRAYDLHWRSWAGAGLLLLTMLLRPIPDTLRYGQMDVLILALFALGLLALQRGRWGWLGAALGFAVALKLYPAYLLGLALVQRQPRAIVGAALAGGSIGLASLIFPGWGSWQIFLNDVLTTTGVGTGWVENQTFNGFLNRLLDPTVMSLQPDGGGMLRVATYAWFALITGVTAWLSRPDGGLRPDIAYGLWITALLVVLPAAWFHYQVILLIPFFQAFVLAQERGGLAWPLVGAYALAWGLIAHGNMWTFYHAALYGPYWHLILSYKFYAMLLLYGTISAAGRSATVATAQASGAINPTPSLATRFTSRPTG